MKQTDASFGNPHTMTNTPQVLESNSGVFSIVGWKVPVDLCYERTNGKPLDEQNAKDIRQVGIGVLNLSAKQFKSRTFASEEAAQEALNNA